MKKITSFTFILLCSVYSFAAKNSLTISSPNGNLKVEVDLNSKIYYSAYFKKKQIIFPSQISMTLIDGKVIGVSPILQSKNTITVNDQILNIINYKRKSIENEFNQITINLKGNYAVIFRVYNEGFAYRFKTNFANEIEVKYEEATFNFADESGLMSIHKSKKNYDNNGEGRYVNQNLNQLPDSVYTLTPVIVANNNGLKIAVTEASLFDYPGLNIIKNPLVANSLIGYFAPEVEKEEPNGWVYKITKRRNYIAKTDGRREFPWRVIVVAENDAQLADCDMVYKLAKPAAKYDDLLWIKGGKAAWDWWADWNMQGVDFKGEMSSLTYYKYLIDFAATNKLPYVEVSVGWMNDQNILEVNKSIQMPELMKYAKSKNIGIMVWVVAQTLERQFNDAFELFSKLGVAGIKVDFMDADHQGRINFYEKIAKECMKRKLMVYYHGAAKPTGLERTYPCIITYEAVMANEYNKWSKDLTPKHTVEVAFIRNLAGPMDSNLGAMRNAQGDAFSVSNSLPMSQGTRCHQLAMYISHFSPFSMVCDIPDTYTTDKNCIKLIADIPTNWDDCKALDGKISEYLIMARKNNDNWYVSGLNGDKAKTGSLNLDFLSTGNYTATLFADGINADRMGTDYKITEFVVTQKSIINYNMLVGGGFVIEIKKVK